MIPNNMLTSMLRFINNNNGSNAQDILDQSVK